MYIHPPKSGARRRKLPAVMTIPPLPTPKRRLRPQRLSVLFLLCTTLPLLLLHNDYARLPARFRPHRQLPLHAKRLVLPLDMWERMVHTGTALRRLVQIGQDANFTVVEPFMYASKVSLEYAFENDFLRRNLNVQTASLYYDTEELTKTGHYVSRRVMHERLGRKAVTILDAAVYFEWGDDRRNMTFCDARLRDYQKSHIGWRLSAAVYVRRAVCIGEGALKDVDGSIIDRLFAMVKTWERDCVGVAVMNYRKYGFAGFRFRKPPVAKAMLPSKRAVGLARRMKRNLGQYVAVQMRTGKIFDVFDKYENKLMKEGVKVDRFRLFERWLNGSVSRLVAAAQQERTQLGGGVVYVASDMYNDGWKGGEYCPRQVEGMLKEARRKMESLGTVVFDPKKWGVKQDYMGISAAVDDAVCFLADRYVWVSPSNMGGWIRWQRDRVGRGGWRMVKGLHEEEAEMKKAFELHVAGVV